MTMRMPRERPSAVERRSSVGAGGRSMRLDGQTWLGRRRWIECRRSRRNNRRRRTWGRQRRRGGSGRGRGGGGGTGGCAPNQVWCPGCEPGTGTVLRRRLSRRRVSSSGWRSGRVWIGRRVRQRRHRRSWRHNGLGRPRWRRRRRGRTRWNPEGAPDAAEREAARAARVERQCAGRARARAASFACDPAAAARLRAAIRSPMAANVRPDGRIGLSATLHRHRGQAARSHRARLPLLSASRDPRRAAPRSPARASRQTSARPAEDAASSAAEKSCVNRPDPERSTMRDRRDLDRRFARGCGSWQRRR